MSIDSKWPNKRMGHGHRFDVFISHMSLKVWLFHNHSKVGESRNRVEYTHGRDPQRARGWSGTHIAMRSHSLSGVCRTTSSTQ